MASEANSPRSGREPLSAAKQKRLEAAFDIATKKAAAADYNYATELFEQCVLGDPGNFNYVQSYVENLQKKYKNNRKGSPWAMFQELGSRKALKKALAQQQWEEVIAHGLKVLTVNPWDVPTLTGMAEAASKMGFFECELFYLKCALMANMKDPDVNKLCALALERLGQYNQAIACWHRVEEAKPDDDEAKRAIAVLTVRKQQEKGNFDDDDESARKQRATAHKIEEMTFEQRMRKRIEKEPNNMALYIELAQHFLNDEKFNEAEDLLAKAYELSDGDPDIREKWEDAQLRHLRQKIAKVKDPEKHKKLQQEYFERDLEFCRNRVERYPGNLAFKFDLGYRYLLTKHYNEAIQELQVAKNDPRRRGLCMLVLGQCFQQIKQYRLAMSHYESAIQEIPDRDAENKKRALYSAGRLALAMKDIGTAEKHLTTLAGLDFSYKDVSSLLDKIARLHENPNSADFSQEQRGVADEEPDVEAPVPPGDA